MFENVDMDARNILDDDNPQVCRLCLGKEEDLIFIFDPKGYQGLRLWEVIKELLQVEVSKEDGMPGTICGGCCGKVREFKLFKTRCIRAKISFLTVIASQGMLSDLVPMAPPPTSKAIPKRASSRAASGKDDDDLNVVNVAAEGMPDNVVLAQKTAGVRREKDKGRREKDKTADGVPGKESKEAPKEFLNADSVHTLAPHAALKEEKLHATDRSVPLNGEPITPTGAKISKSNLGRKSPVVVLERLDEDIVKKSNSPVKSRPGHWEEAFDKLGGDLDNDPSKDERREPKKELHCEKLEEKTGQVVNFIEVPVAESFDGVVESDIVEITSALDPLAIVKEETIDLFSQMSATRSSDEELLFVAVDHPVKEEESVKMEVAMPPTEDRFAVMSADQVERPDAKIPDDDGTLVVDPGRGEQTMEMGTMALCGTQTIFMATDDMKEEEPITEEAVTSPEGDPLAVDSNDQEERPDPAVHDVPVILHDDWDTVDEDTVLSSGRDSDSVTELSVPRAARVDSSVAFGESRSLESLLKDCPSAVRTVHKPVGGPIFSGIGVPQMPLEGRVPEMAGSAVACKGSEGRGEVNAATRNYFHNLVENVVRSALDSRATSDLQVNASWNRKRKRGPPSDPSWSEVSDVSELSDEDGSIQVQRVERRASLRSSNVEALQPVGPQPRTDETWTADRIITKAGESGLGRSREATAARVQGQAANSTQSNRLVQMETSIRGTVECWWNSLIKQRKRIGRETIAELCSLMTYTMYFSGKVGDMASSSERQSPSNDKYVKVSSDKPQVFSYSQTLSTLLGEGVIWTGDRQGSVNGQVIDGGGPECQTQLCTSNEGLCSASASGSERGCLVAKQPRLGESSEHDMCGTERMALWKKAEYLFFLLLQVPHKKADGVGYVCRLCDVKHKSLKEIFIHTVEIHFEGNFGRADESGKDSQGQTLLSIPIERLGREMNTLKELLSKRKPVTQVIDPKVHKGCATSAGTVPSNMLTASKPAVGEGIRCRVSVKCIWCLKVYDDVRSLSQHLRIDHELEVYQWWIRSQSVENRAPLQPCVSQGNQPLNVEVLQKAMVCCLQQGCGEQPQGLQQLSPQQPGNHLLCAQQSNTMQRTNARHSGLEESGSRQQMNLPHAGFSHSNAPQSSGQDCTQSVGQVPGMYHGSTESSSMQWTSRQQTDNVQLNEPNMQQTSVQQLNVPQPNQPHTSSSRAVFHQPSTHQPTLDSSARMLTLPPMQWSSTQHTQSSVRGRSTQLPSGPQLCAPTSVSHQFSMPNTSAPWPNEVQQNQQSSFIASEDINSREVVVSEPEEIPPRGGHYSCEYCPEYFLYKRDMCSHHKDYHKSFLKNKQQLKRAEGLYEVEKQSNGQSRSLEH